MKKIPVVVLVLVCLLGLVGCDPGARMLDGDELLHTTVKIELVHYENVNPKLVRLNSRRNAPVFDFSKVTPIATLEEARFEEILMDVTKNELLMFNRTLNEPIGKTLILHQDDGSMIVMYGCVYEKENGSRRYYGGCDIFDENGKFVEYLGNVNNLSMDTLALKYI